MADGKGSNEVCDDLITPGRPSAEDVDDLVERLARCLSGDLQRHALRRCGNPEDAEDAVQDAMTVALRYLEGFRGETSLRSWMIRLVHSACTRKRRGRRNDPRLHSSVEYDEVGLGLQLQDPSMAPEDRAMLEEKLGRVAAALHRLPDQERDLLLRHEGEGASLAEIAEETGQSVAAVRTRLYRARQKIRVDLGEMMDEVPAN